MPLSEEELIKKRLDYAWDWFKFHAKQRTDMFNYFLLFTGILANAYVGLIREKYFSLACALGLLGTLTALGFFLLDFRNKRLVDKSAYVLEILENDEIYKDFVYASGHQARLSRKELPSEYDQIPRWLDRTMRHTIVFRVFQAIVGLGWLVCSLVAVCGLLTT